ncbi:conjugative relaxase [bacterium]|nr:MAG: conjugative relaxase [bacterium]
MLTIRAMSDGKGYSSRHLEHNDYYAEGERVVGHWHGRGARLLGLAGEIKQADFEALRQGFDPRTGGFLRQRRSADRVAPDGKIQSHGRNLYDFTISAPKSVSVMAALGGDKRLVEAHQRAVVEALQELETHAGTRVRQGRANDDRATGNLVVALYHHDTSRELDPQLHTHAVAANLTYDGTEERWRALKASGIYERRSFLTEVYRNALAREVRMLGYEIEPRRNSKGRDNGFEIRGIPDDLMNKYSQRSRQRDKAIEQFTARTERKPTDNEIAILVRESRPDKLTDISTQEVRKRQLSRLTPEESRVLGGAKREAGISPITFTSCERSLQYAKDHVFERVSVAKDYEILAEALRHGRGRIGYDELRSLVALQESLGAILRKGDEIATVASLQRERKMIDCIDRGIGACSRLGGEKTFYLSDHLNPEQNQVLRFVLDSCDQTVNIRGAAGTGKTATLRELRRALLDSGRDVIAVAPTTSAVEELQKVGFKNAATIERLLQDPSTQAAISGRVLIVDEAGMVSGRQMWELLRIAERHSTRVIFSGDTKQIQSVEACDALRVLEKESQLKSIELTQVQRQTEKGYREAMKELRRDPARGFGRLDAIGAVQEVPWLDRAHAIAQAFADAELRGKSALVVCATHEEIDAITEAIRFRRKRTKQLGKCMEIGRTISLNWTTAQKSEMCNFRPGHLLIFHRAVKGIEKNETVEVARVENNKMLVRSAHGELQAITAKQARSFDVCERRAFDVAPGDKLLITANRRTPGFTATNGEIVTVTRIDQHGFIVLNDGRIVPPDFRQFTHGYAVTAHRSQGKSVDEVFISADGMKKELFYVSATRGRENVRVITSDKELLRDSMGRSNARQSASELERSVRPGLHQRMPRGFAAAVRLAWWAAQHISRLGRPFILTRHSPHQPVVERSHDWSIE